MKRITFSPWVLNHLNGINNFSHDDSQSKISQVFNAYQTVPHGRSTYTSNLECAHTPLPCSFWVALCLTSDDGPLPSLFQGSTSGSHSPLFCLLPRSSQPHCPGISFSALPLLFGYDSPNPDLSTDGSVR